MNVTDIIFSVIKVVSQNQDAKSLIACSQVNKHWNRVIKKHRKRFFGHQWMWAYQLNKNSSLLKNFQTSILDLLLRETQISPMIEDTWKLIRFLKRVGEPVTMGLCLDRSIPNNSKTGNGLTYDPDDKQLIEYVQQCIVNWLWKWCYTKDLRMDLFEWDEVEEETDKFFEYFSRHSGDKTAEFSEQYHSFDLFNEDNKANGSKITLYLNKLKIIYQLIENIL